jgi:hypothetical protein
MAEVNVGWGVISPEDAGLSPGTRYTVTWHDCCTSGEFTAVLVAINRSPDGEGGLSVDSVSFDNGVTCDGVNLVSTATIQKRA